MTDIKKNIWYRFFVILVFMLIFSGVIFSKVVTIQVKEGDQLREKSRSQKVEVVQPKRGNILTRDGKVLACSVPEYIVSFDPRIEYFKKNPTLIKENMDSLAEGLAAIFSKDGLDKQYYVNLLTDAEKKHQMKRLHKKTIDYNQLQKIKKLPLLRNGAFKGGLNVAVDNNRVYPYGEMAKRTIGFMPKGSYRGEKGLEKKYDKDLYGDYSNIQYSENSEVEETIDGYDVVTTINTEIQIITHEELTKVLKTYDAEWGCAVVMDVKTGEVLAMSNLSRNENPTDSNYYENYNYAVSGRCDPGSTIKLPSLMIAFEDNMVDLNDTIDTKDGIITYKNGQLVVTDWNHKTHGGFHKLSVCDVFANSSNVGVSKIINKYYVEPNKEWDFIQRLKDFGLDKPCGIDLQNEPYPIVKDPSMTKKQDVQKWSGITLLQMSYGYEIELTPMQILTFYNAVANNGKMMRPYLVKEIKSDSKVIKEFKPQVINRSICSKSTLEKSHKILESVVEVGTAKKYKSKYYKIAGKTGTAQTIVNGRYDKSVLRGSFCGYFPAENPKYSCIVVVQSKTSEDYSAVGIFKKIADRIYFMDSELRNTMLEATSDVESLPLSANGYTNDFKKIYSNLSINYNGIGNSQWIQTRVDKNDVKANTIKFTNGYMPNFYGMGMRDVMFLADSLKINVQCSGIGRLFRQSIKAGTPYKTEDIVVLEFR